jgi:lysophospholipase L1-like esterase
VAPPPVSATVDVASTGAYCLGDSVMLGASSAYFGTLTMCGEVDAEVGRQASAGAGVLQAHGAFPDTVVVHLGTNGTTNAGELDAMLQVVAAVPRVVLVNVQLNGTRPWEASVNAEIAAAVGRWPNVRLADWYAASAGHPDWFRDGLHLTAPGAEAYAATIAAAL